MVEEVRLAQNLCYKVMRTGSCDFHRSLKWTEGSSPPESGIAKWDVKQEQGEF